MCMKTELKKLVVAAITTMISVALHAQIPTASPITDDNLSLVARGLSFIGTVILFFLASYYVIASVFLKFQDKMPGTKLIRGLTFGVLVGFIWWMGVIESVFALGTDFFTEVLTGLFDFIPLVILGLLSAFLVEDQSAVSRARPAFRSTALHAVVFLLVFGGGRVIRYVSGTGGHYLEHMWLAIPWTAGFALVISFCYSALKRAGASGSPLKSAALFSLVIFGVPYAFFVYFVPLIFKGMFVAASSVLAYDLVLVFVSSLICYRIGDDRT